MKNKINELKPKWEKEGRPVISVRMGINTGEMIIGNMGGSERFDYTVIGDNVNLGARLEGVNKEYGTTIIISESTYNFVKDFFITRELDFILVKGKTKPIRIFELIAEQADGISTNKTEALYYYETGLKKFRDKEFPSAKKLFDLALKLCPDDIPSSVLSKRCSEYEIIPPSEEWNGVYVMTHK